MNRPTTMTINSLDSLILQHAPLLPVPRYGELPELGQNSLRYLVAESGVFLELRRPWLHLLWPIQPPHDYKLPYGTVEEFTDYAFDEEAIERIKRMFLVDAARAMPDECAAWAVWNDRDRRLEYRALIADSASPGGVTFHRPRLEEHESLAIDLHSHGVMSAFFSGTDDEDDFGSVKIAIVAGTLDKEPTFGVRLCALGMFIGGDEEIDDPDVQFDFGEKL